MNAGPLALCLVCVGLWTVSSIAAPEGFRLHGRYMGIGSCLKTLAGPGPEPGTERIFASHVYGPEVFDVVAVDPATGDAQVFPSAVPRVAGAWAMAFGADEQLYVGGTLAGHIQRLDYTQGKLVDMGRPSETESYIWQLALGTDKKLYGCTYPSAKLVRFDPATGVGEDLGRMDDTEAYARSVAANDAGFVYVGIGMGKMHLAAYEIATGEHRDILPPELVKPGCVTVHRGDDGVVYAVAGGPCFRLDGWVATPVKRDQVRPEPPLRLIDGRTVSYEGRTITLTDPQTKQATTLDTTYRGKHKGVFRLALGPDDRLYGTTAMPIHFFWADPDTEAWEEIALAGSGEFYSFLSHKGKLIAAAYGGDAPVMVYDPARPWAPGADATGNPWHIHYEGENSGWRPMAMVAGAQGKVYIGAVSGYGQLGGPLCVFDPDTGRLDQYMHVVKDQSVVALTVLADGTVVGGTTVAGGGGSHPTQTEAKLFLWDPQRSEKTFETVPVPGEGASTALATGPDGLVYGVAGPSLFVFDPATREIVDTSEHGLGQVIYNAVAPGPDGELYGLSMGGIFTIDRQSRRVKLLARYPDGITGGFAIRDRRIYFASGAQIVSYELP